MIKIVNVARSFNGHQVLSGVNLEVRAGKITVVIGKSGAGKSVLLKHVAGLLKPDQGTIFIRRLDLAEARPGKSRPSRSASGCCSRGAPCSIR